MWSPDTIRLRFFRTEKGERSYMKWIRYNFVRGIDSYRGEILKLWPGMPTGFFFVGDTVLIKKGRCKGRTGKVHHIYRRLYTTSECVYVWVKIKAPGKYYHNEVYRYTPDQLELLHHEYNNVRSIDSGKNEFC